MTIGQAIQRVQSLYSKGVQSDDSRLSPRHIYSKLVSARSTILLQQIKKKNKINSSNYIVLPLIAVSSVTVSSQSNPGNLTVKRSTSKLPKIVSGLNTHGIEWVMDNLRTKKYSEAMANEVVHLAGSKYTANNIRFILEDDYLYLYGNNIPSVISAKILCEDPYKAALFQSTSPESINPFEVEFPIESALFDIVIDITVKELVEQFKQQQQDIKNNGNEEPQK